MRATPLVLTFLLLAALAPAAQAASLHVAFLEPARTAKPQKAVATPFNVTNLEDERVQVLFEVVDAPGGRWNIVLPDAIILEPGQTATVVAQVLTTYHNGYVKDEASWMLRAVPVRPGTQEPAGEPAILEIGQGVKGWYVPGPGVGLVALGMVGLAMAMRRRD